MKGEVWNKKISTISNAIAGSMNVGELDATVSQLARLEIV
jgi:hypothetical protein